MVACLSVVCLSCDYVYVYEDVCSLTKYHNHDFIVIYIDRVILNLTTPYLNSSRLVLMWIESTSFNFFSTLLNLQWNYSLKKCLLNISDSLMKYSIPSTYELLYLWHDISSLDVHKMFYILILDQTHPYNMDTPYRLNLTPSIMFWVCQTSTVIFSSWISTLRHV